MNEITVYDTKGNYLTELVQWDEDVIVCVKEEEITQAYAVHFFNADSDLAYVVTSTYENGVLKANIPHVLLSQPCPIIGYVYITDTGGNRSVYRFRLNMRKKPKPSNFAYNGTKDYVNIEEVLEECKELAKTSENWANTSKSYAVGGTGTRSGENTDNSKYFSQQSNTYANTAAVKATEAANSASAAKTSETNAKTSETNSAGSASAAKTSETNAATSAANAKTSETNASTSASTAATKAAEAVNSASAAKTSETNAKTSETNSAGSASAAKTSETNAATSAASAASSATTAAAKASAASNSAVTAANEAANAVNSAKVSQSYAVGGTNSRAGENTDNAKYYSEQAQSIYEAMTDAGQVNGVKGNAEANYRTGFVNLTADNIGAAASNHTHTAATQSASGFMSAADKTKLDGIAAGANNYTYTLPAATSTTRGGVKIGYTANGKNYPVLLSNEQMYVNVPWTDTNTTYSNMTAATASAAGKAGLVPAPAAGKQTSFLRGDGTWVIPTNTTYSAATTTAAGLMSAADKTKLDGIATGATANAASTASPKAAGTAAIGTDTGFARGDHVHPLQTTIYSTATAPAAATTYYIPAHTGNSSANKSLVNFSGLYTSQFNGTADALGYSLFILGNSTASGTANNKYGVLRLYGTNAYFTSLRAFDTTSSTTRYIVGTNSAAAVGSATQPVYVSSTGLVTKCTYTLGKSVPSDAVFTDTTYSAATTTTAGLMSAADKTKLSNTMSITSIVQGTISSLASSTGNHYIPNVSRATKALVEYWSDFYSPANSVNFSNYGSRYITGISPNMTALTHSSIVSGPIRSVMVGVDETGRPYFYGNISSSDYYRVTWYL